MKSLNFYRNNDKSVPPHRRLGPSVTWSELVYSKCSAYLTFHNVHWPESLRIADIAPKPEYLSTFNNFASTKEAFVIRVLLELATSEITIF